MKPLLLIPAMLCTLSCACDSKKAPTVSESPSVTQLPEPVREQNNPMMIPQPIVIYTDSSGVNLQVFHFIAEPEKIIVTSPDGSEQLLTQTESASGVRYTNAEGYQFWEHQREATYSLGDRTIFVGQMQ